MINLGVYRDVKCWKKPVHVSRTLLAKSYLKILSNIDVIGITGSVGKTLTQNAIVSVLSQKFKVVAPEENLDPTFRIPQTILKTKPWQQKMVLEYGVEHPGDMDYYLSLVKPKIAVITVISPTHLKYFKNVEGVYKEKTKLVESLPKNGYAILNADDPMVVKMADYTRAQVKWFGKSAKDGVKISHYLQSLKGSTFRLHYQGQRATVKWKIVGEHQLTSAYAAAAIGITCGLTIKQIASGLNSVKPPEHRLSAIVTKKVNIIDDTYNASPKAAQESIKTLVETGKGKAKIAVFGEMKDLGTQSEYYHHQLGERVAKSKINYLVTVGKIAKTIATGAKSKGYQGKIIKTANTQEAAKEIKKIITPKSLVLVKGSRHAHLERIVMDLLHKSTQISCFHCGILK